MVPLGKRRENIFPSFTNFPSLLLLFFYLPLLLPFFLLLLFFLLPPSFSIFCCPPSSSFCLPFEFLGLFLFSGTRQAVLECHHKNILTAL